MTIHIRTRVVTDDGLPDGALEAGRDALERYYRRWLAPRLWRATPVDSGKTLRGWRIVRHRDGVSILNETPYARWIRRGGLSRASFAILIKALKGAIGEAVRRGVRRWLLTPDGLRWLTRPEVWFPLPEPGTRTNIIIG